MSALVGGRADLDAGPGEIHITSRLIGLTKSDGSTFGGSLVSVGAATASSTHTPTVTTTVAANAIVATSGSRLELLSVHNFDAGVFLTNKGAFAATSSANFGVSPSARRT